MGLNSIYDYAQNNAEQLAGNQAFQQAQQATAAEEAARAAQVFQNAQARANARRQQLNGNSTPFVPPQQQGFGFGYDPFGGFFNNGLGGLATAGASMWNNSQNALANLFGAGAGLELGTLQSNNQLKAQQQALANQMALGQGGLNNQLTLGQGALSNQSNLINSLFGGKGGSGGGGLFGGLGGLFNGLFGGGSGGSGGGIPGGGGAPQAMTGFTSPSGQSATLGGAAPQTTAGQGYYNPMQPQQQGGGNPMATYNRQFVPKSQLPMYDAIHGTLGQG